MTTLNAPDSGPGPEIRPAARQQKTKRSLSGYLGGFIALLVLTAACGSTSGATIPTDSTSSASASITATDSDTPSPAASSPSPPPAAPPAIPTSAIAPAPANPPSAPAPPPPPPPPPAPTTAQGQSCYPLTNGGNCYEPGEYCRNSDHGVSGIDGNGDAIKCEYNNGWRWERV